MGLNLIGTGVSFDITLTGLEILKSAELVYVERYTNLIEDEKISALEEKIAKGITPLPREKVESNFLVEKAACSEVCLLSSGDPLTATTHIVLLMEAKKRKISTTVIHNSSIYTAAAGLSGLQIYRFGKTASLVNPRKDYNPTSSLKIIRKNLTENMHSLVLLDTEPCPMDAKKALSMLEEFEYVVVLSRIGENDQMIRSGRIDELKGKHLGNPPFSIIIPAKLHIVEKEYLDLLK